MIEEFKKMMFDTDEGITQTGFLLYSHGITGSKLVFATVIIGTFIAIIVYSGLYKRYKNFFLNTLPNILTVIGIVMLLILALYHKAYGEILFVVAGSGVALVIATREEFSGLRKWLDRKIGWLF